MKFRFFIFLAFLLTALLLVACPLGDTLPRTMINPEFPGGWQDVLRLQTLPNQRRMQADVAWQDMYRLKIPADSPLMDMRVKVYILKP